MLSLRFKSSQGPRKAAKPVCAQRGDPTSLKAAARKSSTGQQKTVNLQWAPAKEASQRSSHAHAAAGKRKRELLPARHSPPAAATFKRPRPPGRRDSNGLLEGREEHVDGGSRATNSTNGDADKNRRKQKKNLLASRMRETQQHPTLHSPPEKKQRTDKTDGHSRGELRRVASRAASKEESHRSQQSSSRGVCTPEMAGEGEKTQQLLQKFAVRGVAAKGSLPLVERLQGGRFRSLNEFLYTTEGREALSRYQEDPKLFELYHAGYRAQVRSWPLNPLDRVVRWLKKQPANWIVGDFGCGEATLALRFPERKFHSFDLVAANERITVCDIAHVPLENSCLDVAVFCLSLMGKNWPAFLKEARRVLKPKGHLLMVEVASRVECLPDFTAAVEGLGFKNNKQEDLASFFFFLAFSKEYREAKKPWTPKLTGNLLRPCPYKRR
ncbi:hypothetical protein Efla_000046 [Eimeria flavescens]